MFRVLFIFLVFLFSCGEDIRIVDVTYKYPVQEKKKNTHINAITLHHSAGYKLDLDYMYMLHKSKKFGGIAYHFVVDKDGTIYKTRPTSIRGSHMIGTNRDNIGICFIGNYEIQTMPRQQIEAGKGIIKYLIDRYPIDGLYLHKMINHVKPGHTDCPGKNFPNEIYRDYFYVSNH